MTATAIIIITCLLLHRTGVFNKFLTACKVSADPEKIPETPPAEPEEGRQKWENEARYVLTIQGRTNPDTVKYMGDEMLKRIVRDYLDI